MAYNVRIIADSISPAGKRITTWELTYPRFVHAELMTHRLFSRNSASSRAIPVKKLRERVRKDPAMPLWWGRNQSGMQAREELVGVRRWLAVKLWLWARWFAIWLSWAFEKIGLHKQIANRVLEPWMYITVVVTATEHDNWFFLRNHPDAQPEIAWVARTMYDLYEGSRPKRLQVGEWHLPFIYPEDRDTVIKYTWAGQEFEIVCNNVQWQRRTDILKKVSTGRCARVSYLTHDGRRDLDEDVKLHDRLIAGIKNSEPGHWSPFEHVAQALLDPDERSGNFFGWKQYRKEFESEHHGRKLS